MTNQQTILSERAGSCIMGGHVSDSKSAGKRDDAIVDAAQSQRTIADDGGVQPDGRGQP